MRERIFSHLGRAGSLAVFPAVCGDNDELGGFLLSPFVGQHLLDPNLDQAPQILAVFSFTSNLIVHWKRSEKTHKVSS